MTAQLSERSTSTTLRDGTVIPAFSYDDGRAVCALGHVETEAFLRSARMLFWSHNIGTHDLDEDFITRRYVLLREEADGSITIIWRVEETGNRVVEATPGAVAVTLAEL